MSPVHESLEKLEQLARELEQRGEAMAAQTIVQQVATLRTETTVPQLMTTGEAAEALGIRSINTIKRWAQDGKLEGYRRGGRVLVSARSVAAMAESSLIARQRAVEREFDEAVAPFDAGDAEPLELGMTTAGRKPWDANAPSRA